MKKIAVIAAMALLSVTVMTACGNKENKGQDNQNNQKQTDVADNQTEPNAGDNTEDNQEENVNDNTEDKENNTEVDNDTEDENSTGNNSTDKDQTDKTKDDKETDQKETNEKEPVEAGEEPDFKLNEKGCFNGSYEGNDGCTYKFTKKGKLIITSDSETLKYEYTLNDDVLSMVAEDGSFGTSRQITLLEDGTYLLDDNMGTQVILTYIEA